MKNTIKHESLESTQAYRLKNPQRCLDIHQCKNCLLFNVTDEEKEICARCEYIFREYHCTDCVKCKRIVPIDQTSEDGYCMDCWVEENPVGGAE